MKEKHNWLRAAGLGIMLHAFFLTAATSVGAQGHGSENWKVYPVPKTAALWQNVNGARRILSYHSNDSDCASVMKRVEALGNPAMLACIPGHYVRLPEAHRQMDGK